MFHAGVHGLQRTSLDIKTHCRSPGFPATNVPSAYSAHVHLKGEKEKSKMFGASEMELCISLLSSKGQYFYSYNFHFHAFTITRLGEVFRKKSLIFMQIN
ncbi:hypothetical protein AVEN_171482-1 [Araneus ventricosus]|uniref:Uncharacterized protein n=1 Tax=Araneus ventricosus TaxID=182803 RepID=A0A4Y2HB13_ARAVE|nr:hypothetical protein AVEN_171482-1 [Araneus ventricosus]